MCTDSTLEATQGQIDGFFSQFPCKCHPNRVASVGDPLEICPWVTPRVVKGAGTCVQGRLDCGPFQFNEQAVEVEMWLIEVQSFLARKKQPPPGTTI